MIGRVLALGAVVVLTATLTAASNAQAQDEEELYYEKESSAYAEFSGSFAVNEDEAEDRYSGGIGLVVGGHVTTHFSMEAQYDWQDFSGTHLANYNLRYTFLTDMIQPWIRAGIGIMGGRPGHPFLFMTRLGAGTNLFLTEQWAVAPSISYAIANHHNNVFSANLGVVYYFE